MRALGLACACGKCSLAKFSLKEIKKIINWKDNIDTKEPSQGYKKPKKELTKIRKKISQNITLTEIGRGSQGFVS